MSGVNYYSLESEARSHRMKVKKVSVHIYGTMFGIH